MPPLDLRRLLQDPFGPYPEEEILRPGFIRNNETVPLSSVSMECGHEPIGLDESEFIIAAPESSRIARNSVHFVGKLEVLALDWLSEAGHTQLQTDLRRRDEEIQSRRWHQQKWGTLVEFDPEDDSVQWCSQLTLKKLYGNIKGEGSRVTVWVECEKNMQVVFHGESEGESEALTFQSKTGRRYRILSLDQVTSNTSQVFLARWRLWSLVNEITNADTEGTPMHKRDIDWLVRGYLTRRPQGRHQLDDTSHAKIVDIFAKHAVWLLATQLAPQSSALIRVDIAQWIKFCLSRNQNQGTRHGRGRQALIRELVELEGTSDFWDKKLDRTMKRQREEQTRWETREQAAAMSEDGLLPHDKNSTSASARASGSVPNFIYDSDMSDASTIWDSDSSNTSSVAPTVLSKSRSSQRLRNTKPRTGIYTTKRAHNRGTSVSSSVQSRKSDVPSKATWKDLASRIPAFCFEQPEVPRGRFKWGCPGEQCMFEIDLLQLQGELRDPFNKNTTQSEMGMDIDLTLDDEKRKYDEQAEQAFAFKTQVKFFSLVSEHYKSHMRLCGVDLVQRGSKMTLESCGNRGRGKKKVVYKEIKMDLNR